MRCAALVAVLAVVAASDRVADAALTPVGDAFQVSTATSGYCLAPRAAVRADGGFHVVWQDYDPTNAQASWDVRGRRFDGISASLGDEQTLSAFTSGFQETPSVAIGDGGQFVVAWSGAGDGDDYGTFARVFDSGGTPMTGDVPLHDATANVYERAPWVAGAGDEFLVAWVEDARVAGIRLDSSGATKTPFESAVDEPNHVALDSLPGGDFVMVWSSSQYATDNVAYGETGRVEGRFFTNDGAGGDGFQMNAGRDDPTGYGFVIDGAQSLSVAADATGNFVAGYDSYVPSYVYNVDEQVAGYNLGAKTERVVAGVSQGAGFVAADPATATTASVAMTPGGNVIVVHESDDLFARAEDCRGADISGGYVDVTGDATLGAGNASVSANENGDVVVVWEQQRPGGNGAVIAGRRFLLSEGCVLCGDADASGKVTAVDALAALRTSVGLSTCDAHRCDVDGSLAVAATDALRILAAAVETGKTTLSCAAASS